MRKRFHNMGLYEGMSSFVYFGEKHIVTRMECYYNRHFWPYLVNKFEKVAIFPVFSVPI